MKYLYAIGFCLVLALSACLPSIGGGDTGGGDAVGTALAQTQAVADQAATIVAQTQAAMQAGGNVVQPPAGDQQPAQQGVTASANIALNCRYGPDASYDLVEVMNQGTIGTIIAKNTTKSPAWYKLQLADGKECWASSENLTITGSVAGLTEITTGFATPVPVSAWWAGTWTIYYNNWLSNDPSDEEIYTAYWNVTGPNSVSGYLAGTPCSSATTTLTISVDGYTATGTQNWTGGACGASRELHLRLDTNKNQFRGQMIPVGAPSTTDWYYAGSKNGYPAPSPRR